jgi:hypothetical protein
MKYYFVAVAILFICCKAKETTTTQSPNFQITNSDTCKTDSLKHITDSLKVKLFVAEYKLQRVNYYINIVNKNPSQVKYLKGWIKRAIQ